MILLLRKTTQYIVQALKWAFLFVIFSGIAIFAVRGILPFLSTKQPFSHWEFFRVAQENTTIINNREEIIVRDDDRLDRIVENAGNAVVSILGEKKTSLGVTSETFSSTGIFVTNDGLIATHFEEGFPQDTSSFSVLTLEGEWLEAEFFSYDTFTDITYLRVTNGNFSPVPFANSDDFQAGRKVVALSADEMSEKNKLTLGVIRFFDTNFSLAQQLLATSEKHQGVFDIAFLNNEIPTPGTAVLSYDGELVGIAGLRVVGNETKAYVLDANTIRTSLDRVIVQREREEVFFGVSYTPLSPFLNKIYTVGSDNGAWLAFPERASGTVVLFGSPAQKAGLRYGDVILAIDDIAITPKQSLADILHQKSPEDEITLSILREGEAMTLTTTLQKMPQ